MITNLQINVRKNTNTARLINEADYYTVEVFSDDTSYHLEAIMKRSELYLHFTLFECHNIRRGSYVDYNGKRYILYKDSLCRKISNREYEYTLTATFAEGKLASWDDIYFKLYEFDNNDPYQKRITFSMHATAKELLRLVVANCNHNDPNYLWVLGEFIPSEREFFNGADNWRTVDFNEATIYTALQHIADTFEAEWELEYHTNIATVPVEIVSGSGANVTTTVQNFGSLSSSQQATAMLYITGHTAEQTDYSSVNNGVVVVRLKKRITYYTSANDRLTLSYKNGLQGGIQLETINDEPQVKKVYIKAGNRNIVPISIDATNGNYPFNELHLVRQNTNLPRLVTVNGKKQINASAFTPYTASYGISGYNNIYRFDPIENSVEYLCQQQATATNKAILQNGVTKEISYDCSEIFPMSPDLEVFAVVAGKWIIFDTTKVSGGGFFGSGIVKKEMHLQYNPATNEPLANIDGLMSVAVPQRKSYIIYTRATTSNNDPNLNDVNVLTPNTEAVLRFQTGNISGEVEYKVIRQERNIQIQGFQIYSSVNNQVNTHIFMEGAADIDVNAYLIEPVEVDGGRLIPSENQHATVGDKFNIFNIMVSDAKILKAEQTLRTIALTYIKDHLRYCP